MWGVFLAITWKYKQNYITSVTTVLLLKVWSAGQHRQARSLLEMQTLKIPTPQGTRISIVRRFLVTSVHIRVWEVCIALKNNTVHFVKYIASFTFWICSFKLFVPFISQRFQNCPRVFPPCWEVFWSERCGSVYTHLCQLPVTVRHTLGYNKTDL